MASLHLQEQKELYERQDIIKATTTKDSFGSN